MKATIETTKHLNRDQLTAIEIIAKTINSPAHCANWQQAKEWCQCLQTGSSGWFVYHGGNHIAIHLHAGVDSPRVLMITDGSTESSESVQPPISLVEARKHATAGEWQLGPIFNVNDVPMHTVQNKCGVGVCYATKEDAILIAHEHNIVPKLMEALDAALSRMKGTAKAADMPFYAKDEIALAEAVLKEALTVKTN